jgi:2'-5' RNA ligase
MLRRQLSLFVPAEASAALEAVRQQVDPVQHQLIPAHVTLCRDDESGDETVRRLASLRHGPLTLRFGRAVRFSGHGLLLPCIEGEPAFQTLRAAVLGTAVHAQQHPHLTLAHPRNPKAPGNALESTAQLPATLTVTFSAIHLIEQRDGAPWRVLAATALAT